MLERKKVNDTCYLQSLLYVLTSRCPPFRASHLFDRKVQAMYWKFLNALPKATLAPLKRVHAKQFTMVLLFALGARSVLGEGIGTLCHSAPVLSNQSIRQNECKNIKMGALHNYGFKDSALKKYQKAHHTWRLFHLFICC